MKSTIFIKLISTLFAVILICLIIVGVSLSIMMKNYLFNQKETELTIKGRDTAEIIKPYLINNEDPRLVVNLLNSSDLNLGIELWIVDKQGSVIAAAANHRYCEGNFLEEAELRDMRAGLITVRRGQSAYFTDAVIRVTVPIIEKDEVIGAVIMYSPILGINRALSSILEMIVAAGLLSFVVAFLIGIILSRRLSDPIINLTSASAAIARGEKHVEVSANTGTVEINHLNKTFNYMAEKIEENEKKMKDFVANVSHELRSPLTSIKGFVQALIDNKGKNEEDRRKFLYTISRETDRLDNLVTSLLALTRAENYGNETPDEVDPVKTVKEVLVQFRSAAADKGIRISLRDDESIPKVKVVHNELKQVLINLLDNAIKYSLPDKSIEISFDYDDQFVQIFVEDKGYGIPAEELDHIWDRFYRVDKARSRETGGTGLGLSIVKQLVEKNNGMVGAQSVLGEGSVFSFTLPVFKG